MAGINGLNGNFAQKILFEICRTPSNSSFYEGLKMVGV